MCGPPAWYIECGQEETMQDVCMTSCFNTCCQSAMPVASHVCQIDQEKECTECSLRFVQVSCQLYLSTWHLAY